MRRTALLLTVGLLSAGLGCKHIAGKCDCNANPADAVLPGPTTPYPAQPMITVPAAGTATSPMGVPMTMPTTPSVTPGR